MQQLRKLLIFDSHPVQYRVPIWQQLNKYAKGCFHVAYGSDCSVRGYTDRGFGETFSWDEPLLKGYSYTILNCEQGEPLSGWKSLTGRGVKSVIKQFQPDVILLTGLNYRYDLVAYLCAIRNGIPLWLRCETQDEATLRSPQKSLLRSLVYKFLYMWVNHFFYIGELNKEHYLRHSVPVFKLSPALYGTVNRFDGLSTKEKETIREAFRKKIGADSSTVIVGFAGKFIKKKNPQILFEMLDHLSIAERKRVKLYFIGSGELDNELKSIAAYFLKKYNIQTHFTGFVNQSKLADHYLAIDILVLPSKRMGETWGLVANEAMQAGCNVVVSDAVGCCKNFYLLERFKVFEENNSVQLAKSISFFFSYSRDYDWANEGLKRYSIEATSKSIIEQLDLISRQRSEKRRFFSSNIFSNYRGVS